MADGTQEPRKGTRGDEYRRLAKMTFIEIVVPAKAIRESTNGLGEVDMSKWEYRSVVTSRTGTHEDFSTVWTYTPWMLPSLGNQSLEAGLQELGRQGWELVGIMPTDIWTEGTRSPNASHGIRTISSILLFKKPLGEPV